jgi:O-methyltransferase
VKNYLKDYQDVYFYKGLFPSTATAVEDKRFSFVHLDVDTYESTRSCLRFFYPRMNRGGIILSHDYISAAGVRKAFDEFFNHKVEPIIEMSGTQCLVVKL